MQMLIFGSSHGAKRSSENSETRFRLFAMNCLAVVRIRESSFWRGAQIMNLELNPTFFLVLNHEFLRFCISYSTYFLLPFCGCMLRFNRFMLMRHVQSQASACIMHVS